MKVSNFLEFKRYFFLSDENITKGTYINVTIAYYAKNTFVLDPGANSSLTAAVVVLTGLVGANFVQTVLDRLGFTDPIARGIATASRYGQFLEMENKLGIINCIRRREYLIQVGLYKDELHY